MYMFLSIFILFVFMLMYVFYLNFFKKLFNFKLNANILRIISSDNILIEFFFFFFIKIPYQYAYFYCYNFLKFLYLQNPHFFNKNVFFIYLNNFIFKFLVRTIFGIPYFFLKISSEITLKFFNLKNSKMSGTGKMFLYNFFLNLILMYNNQINIDVLRMRIFKVEDKINFNPRTIDTPLIKFDKILNIFPKYIKTFNFNYAQLKGWSKPHFTVSSNINQDLKIKNIKEFYEKFFFVQNFTHTRELNLYKDNIKSTLELHVKSKDFYGKNDHYSTPPFLVKDDQIEQSELGNLKKETLLFNKIVNDRNYMIKLVQSFIQLVDESMLTFQDGELFILCDDQKFKNILKECNYNFFDDSYLNEFAY